MISSLKKIRPFISRKEKIQLIKLIIFTFINSLFELIGIGIIMPFVQIVTDFSKINKEIYNYFDTPIQFIITFGIAIIIFYIIKSIINFNYYKYIAIIIQNINKKISQKLFKSFIGYSYELFIERNSSNFIKSIVRESEHTVNTLYSYILIFNELMIATLIYGMLFYINPQMTLFLTIFLAITITIIKQTITKKIKHIGETKAIKENLYFEVINNSLKNFKLIKIHSKEEIAETELNEKGNPYFDNVANFEAYTHLPRILLEGIGFSLIILILIYMLLIYQNDISQMLSLISVFILALYRLMPSVNRLLTNYNMIIFLEPSINSVNKNLSYKKEEIGNEKIDFKKEISVENLNLILNGKQILKDISFKIKKGEKVAFTGKSGEGKSVLIDTIIGFYKPTSGKIKLDSKEVTSKNIKDLRSKIGYISQEVFIFPASIEENIAFDNNIDEKKLNKIIKDLNLNFANKKTLIGDGGLQLSGGQKQCR
jgi:ATP-binding cassette subfamily B protein